jgi:hypothetical protein
MAYKVPNNIQAPKPPPLRYWPETPALLNGGLNIVDREWKVSDNQSPKILNMWYREGELSKRYGQEYVADSITVETPCFATYDKLYEGHIIKHCGTKIYKQDPTTETTTEIFTGLTAAKGSFFKFGDKLYYLQAGKYIQYDGTVVTEVSPYVPVVIINRTPTGGGDVLENYNRIGKGFTNKFNGDASAVAYTLTDAVLDADLVICTVDGVTKVETVDFTVDRTTGIVTFTLAPGVGTNNVILTAYKTVQADIDSILKCTIAIPFGGQNDNRLFIGGNGTGYFYWTGISANGIDATYFAYNNYNVIGNSDEDITAFGKHYDTLTIHKESGEIFGETYTFDGTKGIFNTFPINQQYGCDCPGTIQNINNQLVWLNSRYGVCILVGTTVGSQRNAFPISRNIDPRLMKETNLKTASSVNFNGKYWLCVNDKVYLWDYFISPYYSTGNPDADAQRLSWWYFDNINAGSFIIDANTLYYVDRTVSKVIKFVDNFVDFDGGISAIYRIPLRDFGNSIYEFDVLSMWVDVRSDTRTEIQIAYVISDESTLETELDEISVGSFSIPGFSIPSFTLNVMGFRQTFVFQPLEKKIDLFGVEFTNNSIGRDMNISNVTISYKIGKRKR